MCTVSFIPSNKGIIVTSNRDEQVVRQPASLPQAFNAGSYTLYYPVDGKANGTWFLMRSDGSIGVLLNGAIEKHVPLPNYKASRGSILPYIFKYDNPVNALKQMDLVGIENCTLIIYHQGRLHECKWNGEHLGVVQIDNNQAHIYSSVTLYDKDMIEQREDWFASWLSQNNNPSQEEVIAFHANTNSHNKEFGLQINRANLFKTVSITSVCIHANKATLFHHDLLQEQFAKKEISLTNQQVVLA